jgi:hypothetical protein
MIKTADAAQSSLSTFISVDAADVNGNGTPEIYVSSLGSRRTTVDSFVIEYSGGSYATISKGDNWFYRVGRTPDHGALLLGQRQRLHESSIFNGPINEMRWEGDRLVPGRQGLPGRLANLMGLAYGDITHSGTSVVAAYSNQDRVRIYNGNGDRTWEAAERSGGDMLFFNLPKTSAGQPNKQFFPLRIRITDIDRDGKVELMIAHHDELANSMLASFRNFKNAKIASVEWDGLGLAPKWETQQLSGRISDFAVGDVDNDGADELLIALVVKEGAAIFTDSISSLIAFDLKP